MFLELRKILNTESSIGSVASQSNNGSSKWKGFCDILYNWFIEPYFHEISSIKGKNCITLRKDKAI